MSRADELRSQVGVILFDLQSQLTRLNEISKEAESSGEAILRLRSHNLSVMTAGGILTNLIISNLGIAIADFKRVIEKLEEFREVP